MLGHRTNLHCMLGQLAAELCAQASLYGIATLAPLTRHLGSAPDMVYPVRLLNVIGIREAIMAE